MNAFAGIRPKGVETRPPPYLFSLAFAVGVFCFPVGIQPPQPHSPRANFYPEYVVYRLTLTVTVNDCI